MEKSLVKYLLQTLKKNDHIDMSGGGLLEQTDTFNLKWHFDSQQPRLLSRAELQGQKWAGLICGYSGHLAALLNSTFPSNYAPQLPTLWPPPPLPGLVGSYL